MDGLTMEPVPLFSLRQFSLPFLTCQSWLYRLETRLLRQLEQPPVRMIRRRLSPKDAASISCRSRVAMADRDSRSVPHI